MMPESDKSIRSQTLSRNHIVDISHTLTGDALFCSILILSVSVTAACGAHQIDKLMGIYLSVCVFFSLYLSHMV